MRKYISIEVIDETGATVFFADGEATKVRAAAKETEDVCTMLGIWTKTVETPHEEREAAYG